jgi:hypothetical protein
VGSIIESWAGENIAVDDRKRFREMAESELLTRISHSSSGSER